VFTKTVISQAKHKWSITLMLWVAMMALVSLYVYLDNSLRSSNRSMQLIMQNMGHNLLILPVGAEPIDAYVCTDSQALFDQGAKRLRIGHRLDHKAGQLSVGELQRASVARALIGGQKTILADEPTGNLDDENIEIVGQCLKDESTNGRMVVLVTHNRGLLKLETRHVRIDNGRLEAGGEGPDQ